MELMPIRLLLHPAMGRTVGFLAFMIILHSSVVLHLKKRQGNSKFLLKSFIPLGEQTFLTQTLQKATKTLQFKSEGGKLIFEEPFVNQLASVQQEYFFTESLKSIRDCANHHASINPICSDYRNNPMCRKCFLLPFYIENNKGFQAQQTLTVC